MNTKNKINKSFDALKNSANQKCRDIENFISELENIINSENLTIEEKTNLILNHDYGMEIWAERQKFVREWFKSIFDFADVVEDNYHFILEYKNWRFLFNKNTKIIKIYNSGDMFYIVRTPEEIEEQYKKRFNYEKAKAAIDYYDKKISLKKYLKIKYDNQGACLMRYIFWMKHRKKVNRNFYENSINDTLEKIKSEKELCRSVQLNFQISLNDLNMVLKKINEILPSYTYDISDNDPIIKEKIEKSLKEGGFM